MIRIGAVNIDTSHPLGFGEVMEKANRARYVGVYNDSFRSDAEVDGFIHRFGLERRCDTLQELAGMCDIGFIHGCNWDDHLRCALPFLQAGKPVFIDKPIVGNLTDCARIEELAHGGAVILGASSARYAFEVQDFLDLPVEERGEIVQVLGTAGVDEFNYGIHIVEAIGGLLGTGAQSVQYVGRGEVNGQYSESYCIHHSGGKNAIYTTFTGVWQPFTLTIMTTKGTHALKIDSSRLYEALINQICNYMEGKPHQLAGVDALLESVRVMLAGCGSRARHGEAVRLDELQATDPAYDGAAFHAAYGHTAVSLYHKA